MKITFKIFFALALIFCIGGYLIMPNDNNGWHSPPKHPDAGKYEPWACAFERGKVPPLNPEAEAMFLQARALERSKPRPYLSDFDKQQIFEGYKKAAELQHWRAMINLANCYLNGFGTAASVTSADAVYEEMMALGIPAGYYGKYTLVARGRGVPRDAARARELLHLAADFGHPQAQYDLGEHYIDGRQRHKQGVGYHICALRQGYAPSANALGMYSSIIEENHTMAVEYYWRAVALGYEGAALELHSAYAKASATAGVQTNLGVAPDEELSKKFNEMYEEISADPTKRYPNLLIDLPIPENPTLSRADSRKRKSFLRLKDGSWPDEVYPELAPGYVTPRY